MGVSFLTEKIIQWKNRSKFHPNMCNMTQKKIESIFKESIIEIGCDHAISHKK